MPRLSVWMIRTALLHLGLGFTLGAVILYHKGLPFWPGAWRLLPLHVELVLFGWTLQLALGVAFWILPRYAREPVRGREGLPWLAYGLLNLGALTVGLAGWLAAPPALALVGRAAELLAAFAFAAHLWPRVKPLGA